MSRVHRPSLPPGDAADVALILEGTYLYVGGGVSSWVHQLIRGLPEVTFSIVFIRCLPGSLRRYEVHTSAECRPPGGALSSFASKRRAPGVTGWQSGVLFVFHTLHDAFRQGAMDDIDEALNTVIHHMLSHPSRCEADFLYSELSWSEITRRYEQAAPERSFLEFFWTIRSMHAPLFMLARAAAGVPPARAYHVISTGFGGFLAMLLRRQRRRPLLLTEHGIYTKERRIELLQANWIGDDNSAVLDADGLGVGFIRQLWIRFFERLGVMTYDAADPIIALYEGNRARQIADRASRDRTVVVPNGINIERLQPLRLRRPSTPPSVMALIGRVVPIKDIKTFVRASRIVCNELPGAEAWIVGPEDEDPSYAQECHELVVSLGLEGRVKFLGFQRIDDIFPAIGVNVLTSMSEAQPLVVLEGFASGVPCVATDVGCCRELIEGISEDDRALGVAGDIVGIANSESTARSALALLGDASRWTAAQRAGIARVERYYAEPKMLDTYRTLYRAAMGS